MWTKVTDAGLVHLKGLTALEQLDLSYTRVTGSGLEHLNGSTALQQLDLSRIPWPPIAACNTSRG